MSKSDPLIFAAFNPQVETTKVMLVRASSGSYDHRERGRAIALALRHNLHPTTYAALVAALREETR